MKNDLKKIIIEMMNEKTEKHILYDDKDIIIFDEPLRFDKFYGVEIPIQDFMNAFFELDTLCNEINDVIKLENKLYKISDVYDYLKGRYNITSEGATKLTYYYEHNLSRGFIFKIIEIEGIHYCLFQLHNGANIKVGYTKTRIFKLADIADVDDLCLDRLVIFYIKYGNKYKVFFSFEELRFYAEENGLEITERGGKGYLDGVEINYDLLYK